jgi:hypothetical protein
VKLQILDKPRGQMTQHRSHRTFAPDHAPDQPLRFFKKSKGTFFNSLFASSIESHEMLLMADLNLSQNLKL